MNKSNRFLLTLIGSLFFLNHAMAQTVSYRYFRWIPTEFRDLSQGTPSNMGTHISEFEFLIGGSRIPGATVTQIDGANGGGEGPQNVYDGSVDTKWFDFERQPLIFDFGSEVSIDGYRWATANAANWRDPIRWILEGSDDLTNWILIDDRDNADQDVTTARMTFIPELSLNSAVQVDFTITFNGLTGSSVVVPAGGGQVTLNWTIANASSATLSGVTNPPNPLTVTSVTDSPTATTTYTLTASTGENVVTREVIAFFGDTDPVVINEFLTDGSRDSLCDEDGNSSDWIELFNPNPVVVGVGGISLTNDPTNSNTWPIPAGTTIAPGGYLTIFASGKNRNDSDSELHTDFTLDSTPGRLALLDSDGSTVLQQINYPQQQQDVSYGSAGSGFNFFFDPTPGAENTTAPGLLAPAVQILEPSQSFASSLAIPLATSSPSAQIFYTLDGSIPVQGTNDTFTYNGSPIAVAFSTTIRARAYQSGFAPGPVSTESYLRIDDNVTSRTHELPVIVIDNFNGGALGTDGAESASLAIFEPDTTSGMTDLLASPTLSNRVEVDILKSAGDAKLGYKLRFREQGTDESTERELLGLSTDTEWLLDAPFAFDRTLLRFPFIHQLSNDVGINAPRTRLVEVYFNTAGNVDTADYRGIYSLQESVTRNPERVAIERLEKFDRAAPEIDGGYILRIGQPEAGDVGFRSAQDQPGAVNNDARPFYTFVDPPESELDQSQSDYIRGYIDDLEAALFGPDFTDPVNGYRQFLDVESAIDFHILTAFAKDPDSQRLKAFLVKNRGERLKFGPISNMERGFSPNTDDRSADPEGWDPVGLQSRAWVSLRGYHWWGRLFLDPDFVQAYNDRWEELRQGEFSNTNLLARVDGLSERIEDFQARNFSAFPQNQPEIRDFSANGLSGWEAELSHFSVWLTRRADWMDLQLITVRPPNLDVGRSVAMNETVNLGPDGGVLYYTTNGSDPREPGGEIQSGAVSLATPGTLPITETTTIFARSRNGSGIWSAPRISTFVIGDIASPGSLLISEIMYHPAAPTGAETNVGGIPTTDTDFEYLELRNVSNQTIDLSGVTISRAIEHTFANGVTLASNASLLLVKNLAAFQARYPGVTPLAAWDSGDLDDAGERIIVTATDGMLLADFSYDNEEDEGWPLAAAGNGASLTIDQPSNSTNPNLPSAWRASVSDTGSPGVSFVDFCEEWKSTFFTTAQMNDPSVSGDGADPDNDGISNLLELGLGQSPLERNDPPLITATVEDLRVGGVTGPYFTISFIRRQAVGGLEVVPAFSNDLEDPWVRDAVFISSRDLGNGSEEVVYRDNQMLPSLGIKRFARIEVQKN